MAKIIFHCTTDNQPRGCFVLHITETNQDSIEFIPLDKNDSISEKSLTKPLPKEYSPFKEIMNFGMELLGDFRIVSDLN